MGRILVQNPSDVVEQKVAFTFTSATVLLQQVFGGDLVDTAWIRIDVPFDDPTATVVLGVTADTGLIFELGNVDVSVAGQTTNQAVTEFAVMDFLQLVVSPAASTQGAGLLVYRYRR
jgi:hypothetical protein